MRELLINKIFVNQVRRNLEAYVYDMVIKSAQLVNHFKDLEEIFLVIQRYVIRLNPKKCVFGIVLGKFLGYLVSTRWIEANLDKTQALVNMKPSLNLKGIQKLNRRIVELNIFISKCTDKCLPFFKMLRKNKSVF